MLSQINARTIGAVLAIIGAGLFQISVMPYFPIAGATGNLVLIFVLVFIFERNYPLSLMTATVGGIILDLSQGIGFGPYLVPLLVVVALGFLLEERFLQSSAFIFYLAALLAMSIIFDIVFIGVADLLGKQLSVLTFWPLILKNAAYNVVLGTLIYFAFKYIKKKFIPEARIKLPY